MACQDAKHERLELLVYYRDKETGKDNMDIKCLECGNKFTLLGVYLKYENRFIADPVIEPVIVNFDFQ